MIWTVWKIRLRRAEAKWADAGVTVTELTDEAAAEFKDASSGVADLFVKDCVDKGFDQSEVESLVAAFQK